ncbi:maleylacetate reductase and hydroxyquinol 1,2-dioxygenase domain-containing protein [Streptomyces sp. NPDC085932]|uniref:maleylacetate reductase and hydroxyquinol 1,2-dioxygenase domain-containing protein n=1 Tax=Streptomyces sp. NPDC085932 TaxID=3365741 RepID=UPI0037D15ECA
MRDFTHTAGSSRIIFGAGTLGRLRDELERLGCRRAWLVSTPQQGETLDRARKILGPLVAGEFRDAAMHTPTDVTELALMSLQDKSADSLVAVGGGSAIGLSKALAARTGFPQIVVPTTYAGSEVTPILGETSNGVKTTRSATSVLPNAVIYDVDLTLTLPIPFSVASGLNAIAHAVEALYSPDANPVTDRLALRAISLLSTSLPEIVKDPTLLEARADALEGAWLAGTCLGTVAMGLHHSLCHTLGGTFGLSHADTHAVLLPYVMAYNASAVPEVMHRIARALGVGDAPTGVRDLCQALLGPLTLRDLGMAEDDLPKAVQLTASKSCANPQDVSAHAISSILEDAWHGRPPEPADRLAAELYKLTETVVASFEAAPDPRVRSLLTDLVRRLHEFVSVNDLTQDEWNYAIGFLTRAGQLCSDTRQEFVLLSDALGISSAVDILSNSRTTGSTPSAVLGPFYLEGPPSLSNGSDIAEGLAGTPLFVSVSVKDLAGNPLPDAVVDVWQSNDEGFYDVQLTDLTGPSLRARFRADAEGRVAFRSILPSEYPIPADGPVGQMLRSTGRHPYRAPHLHFMIDAPGQQRLVTQLFVARGAYIDGDAVFGVKDALVVEFPEHHGPTPDGLSVNGTWRSLDYTFRLAPIPGDNS